MVPSIKHRGSASHQQERTQLWTSWWQGNCNWSPPSPRRFLRVSQTHKPDDLVVASLSLCAYGPPPPPPFYRQVVSGRVLLGPTQSQCAVCYLCSVTVVESGCLHLHPRDLWVGAGESGRQCAVSSLTAFQGGRYLKYFNSGDLQTSRGTRSTGLGCGIRQKITPPTTLAPTLSLFDSGIWDHLPGWQKFAAWTGTLPLGIFLSCLLRHKTWRWRCKHAADVPLRQLATNSTCWAFSCFIQKLPHVLSSRGNPGLCENNQSCKKTPCLQATCKIVQQLQGWMTGRSDLDVLHTCKLAKTALWTCAVFPQGGWTVNICRYNLFFFLL